MNVKFLEEYGGRETAMHIYQAGEVVDIPFAQAQDLLKWGIIEVVEVEQIEEIEQPRRRKVKKEVTDDTNT
jgi:hypothetical protein